MSFLQKALKLLKDFPNLKTEPFQVQDKKKKSFLEEAENFFKNLTSSKSELEDSKSEDSSVPDATVSSPIVPTEFDDEDNISIELDPNDEFKQPEIDFLSEEIGESEKLLNQEKEEFNSEDEDTAELPQMDSSIQSLESDNLDSDFDTSILENDDLTQDLLESERLLQEDEDEGISVSSDNEASSELPPMDHPNQTLESDDSDFDTSILENDDLTQDLLESERILQEDEDEGISVSSDHEASSELPQMDHPSKTLESDDLDSDFDTSILENDDLTQDLLESERILQEDEDEGISVSSDNKIASESPEIEIQSQTFESEDLDSEFDNSILENDDLTQDLIESEKILAEEEEEDGVTIDLDNSDNTELPSPTTDLYSDFENTVMENDDLTEELYDSDDLSNDDTTVQEDENTILENWEKDAMAEPLEESYLSDDDESIIPELNEKSENLPEPIVDINVEDAFESAKQFKTTYEEKVESYLVLFEITKELLKSKSFEDFFENLMYSIIGQVGPEIMIIFSSRDGNFSQMKIVASEGIDIEPDYVIKKGDTLYKLLESESNVIFARDLLSDELKDRERILLENPLTEILIPIRVMDKFSGFIVAGKMISGEEYTDKDFEFLQILVEVSGNFLSKMFDSENLSNEISELNKIINSSSNITDFTNRAYTCKTLDEIYDAISEHLLNDFKVSSFTFMVLDVKNSDFKAFGSNFLLPETMEKLRLSKDSKIVTMISQISDVYRVENFQSNTEINTIISEKELDAMNEFTVIPLINIGRMVGLFIIHKVSTEWSSGYKQTILSLTNIVAPIIANLVMQNEKESLFRNPFNPLQETIEKEIKYSENSNKQFTLIVLKIQNVTRILNILGINFFSDYSEFISKKIFENTSTSDYVSRIGQGKFAILLKENSKADSEKFIEKMKSEIVLFHNPSRDFKLSIQIYALTYPDQAKDKRKFIEMMEET